MSLQQKIAKNTAIQVGGKLLGTALSLLAAGMIFRHLGAAGFGQYTTIMAFLQIFGIMMDFGLYIILIKTIAVLDAKTTPLVNNIFTLRIISGVIFLGLAPLGVWILGFYNTMYTLEILQGVALATLFFFFISLNQLLSAIFQKFLRTDWIALAELIGKIALVISTAVVVGLKLGLLWVMLTLVISSGVNFGVNFWASRKFLRLKLAFDWVATKKILREAWPIALSIGCTLIYFKGDIVLLTFFENNQQVIGWYGAPYRLLEVLITFPAMFAGLILPVLTASWQKQDKKKFQAQLQKSFDALAVIVWPMIAGTLALAPQIINLFAGEQFKNSYSILRILIFAAGAIFYGTLFGYLIVSLDRQKQMLWGYGFVAISSLIGYLIFIPRYSITGAAGMTVYSEVMVFVITASIVLTAAQTRLRLLTTFKCIAGSIGMYIIILLLLPIVANALEVLMPVNFSASFWQPLVILAILVPMGILAYFILLLGIKGITWAQLREMMLLRQAHLPDNKQ